MVVFWQCNHFSGATQEDKLCVDRNFDDLKPHSTLAPPTAPEWDGGKCRPDEPEARSVATEGSKQTQNPKAAAWTAKTTKAMIMKAFIIIPIAISTRSAPHPFPCSILQPPSGRLNRCLAPKKRLNGIVSQTKIA